MSTRVLSPASWPQVSLIVLKLSGSHDEETAGAGTRLNIGEAPLRGYALLYSPLSLSRRSCRLQLLDPGRLLGNEPVDRPDPSRDLAQELAEYPGEIRKDAFPAAPGKGPCRGKRGASWVLPRMADALRGADVQEVHLSEHFTGHEPVPPVALPRSCPGGSRRCRP